MKIGSFSLNNRFGWFLVAVLFHILVFAIISKSIVFEKPKAIEEDSGFLKINLPKPDDIAQKPNVPSLPMPQLTSLVPNLPATPPIVAAPSGNAFTTGSNLGLLHLPSGPALPPMPQMPIISSEANTSSDKSQSPTDNSVVRVEDLLAGQYKEMPYRYFVPKTLDHTTKYPLVVFLHGDGEKGSDNTLQLSKYPLAMTFTQPDEQKNYPCYYVAPQTPRNDDWFNANLVTGVLSQTNAMRNVIGIIDDLESRFTNIDPSRIYITGYSSGGIGTWNAAALYPNKIAAIAPISGDFIPSLIRSIGDSHMPVWTFFSSNDGGSIPIHNNKIQRLLAGLHDNLKTTVYESKSHGIVNQGYSTADLIPWLFSWSKTDKPPPSITSLKTSTVKDTQININWTINREVDLSLHGFNIYRDGVMIKNIYVPSSDQSADFNYTDKGLTEGTSYAYSVTSINSDNAESGLSLQLDATTSKGIYPPAASWAFVVGTNTVIVRFEKNLDPQIFNQKSIYSVDHNISVNLVQILSDSRTLILKTATLSPNIVYTLSITYSSLVSKSAFYAQAQGDSITFKIDDDHNLVREYWQPALGDKVEDIPVDTLPLGFDVESDIQDPPKWWINYGARIRGYLLPPEDGVYHFFVAGKHSVQFWLSTNEDPSNKILLASTALATKAGEWFKDPAQKSNDIPLLKDHVYYFEFLHKVGKIDVQDTSQLDDNGAVAWQIPDSQSPEIISSKFCNPYPDVVLAFRARSNP